jgi:mono/diheme cytochrome c family protein
MKKNILFVPLAAFAFATVGAYAAKVDFKKDVAPIFEKRCIECHGADKKKGGLRMHTKQDLFDSETVVAGKADESEVVVRVVLPKDDDDIMPPKGDPLTKAEVQKIKDWINEGAVWPAGFVIGGAHAKKDDEGPGPAPTDAEKKAVAELEKHGVTVRQIAQKLNWTYVNLRVIGTKFDPKVFALLGQVQTLQELNAAGVTLTAADVAHVGKAMNLRRLHLEHTPVTDAMLGSLKGLSNLEYLNLFDTAVTDAGLTHLHGMKKLKSVYLFQTKTTDKGVADLKNAIKTAYVDTGWDLKELEKIKAEIAKREEERKAKEEAEKKKAEAAKKAAAEKKKKEDAAKKAAAEKKPESKKPAEKKVDEKKADAKGAEEKKAPAKKKAAKKAAAEKKADK